ncbi:BA14K family protein [Bradyrhizobium sp. 192]|uniref:BA14K family protein n=1 Tax=Bradyrhizobium sp. 192 TaxID=2782660 RepID=UPI001FFF2067|nr:BA14K family protein [Bradyrhizobium sp. 192]UPJ55293.1 BA14K family protein [Bradyrhizobium sp. 192]
MSKSSKTTLVALIAATTPWLVAPVAAAPLTSPLMLRGAVAPSVETVQYRRGWRGGYHGGAGIGIGAGIAGALIGGAIIGATQPYGYYGYGPGYGPAYVAPPPYVDDAVGYCARRFRSYDPYSGTYLGYDGLRHPCP